jgi:hypothetical protein
MYAQDAVKSIKKDFAHVNVNVVNGGIILKIIFLYQIFANGVE